MRIFDRISGSLYIGSGIIIFVLFAVTLADVAGRPAGMPVPWAHDLIAFGLVYFTFMAGAYSYKRNVHVRVEIVADRLKPGARYLLDTITTTLGAVVWLVITVAGIYVVWDAIQLNMMLYQQIIVPVWILIIIIPIGSLLLFLESVRKTSKYMQGFFEEKRTIVQETKAPPSFEF